MINFRNRYSIQALFKDSLECFTVNVAAEDPFEAETIVRRQSLRELLIASVIRLPATVGHTMSAPPGAV